MTHPVPFEFADLKEAHEVASLLRKQAAVFQLLTSYLTGDDARKFEEQARDAIAIASRIDTAAREAPSNRCPVNQAALVWLKETKALPDGDVSYLAQLAAWGFHKSVVSLPEPQSASQPDPYVVEQVVNQLMKSGAASVAHATKWFLSNPNLSIEEQADNLEMELREAETPSEASQIVAETAYDLMVAGSATSPE
jgi:hypothetical protein